jgi:hypothetical protein
MTKRSLALAALLLGAALATGTDDPFCTGSPKCGGPPPPAAAAAPIINCPPPTAARDKPNC